ncbi:PREDICTED: zinc finger protein 383-like [Galeopterus variegatus]|uniref:Zinc finger protein 383-like n=1 Tax=Galeopterus variegatus TaxID=482537 RepID=A0ABM0SEY8_GALVR|nr:PREDICTED: zinc finger protein 383-like [Galeopterus variegatus]
MHERTYTGEKLFACKKCGKSLSFLSFLQTHKRTYTGENPYECKKCGKAFRYPRSLCKHERIHTGEKPYKYMKGHTLKRNPMNVRNVVMPLDVVVPLENMKELILKNELHERTHTRKKPYEYKESGKASSCHSSLRKHERTRAEEKPYECGPEELKEAKALHKQCWDLERRQRKRESAAQHGTPATVTLLPSSTLCIILCVLWKRRTRHGAGPAGPQPCTRRKASGARLPPPSPPKWPASNSSHGPEAKSRPSFLSAATAAPGAPGSGPLTARRPPAGARDLGAERGKRDPRLPHSPTAVFL